MAGPTRKCRSLPAPIGMAILPSGARLTRPALEGSFWPAPRKRKLELQRRVGERWVTLRRVPTSASGRYRVEVDRGGAYRVRSRSVAGPTVRVR